MLGGEKAAVAFHGDHRPVSICVDGQSIHEPAESTKSGASVEFENTYNDSAEVTVFGESTQKTLTGKNLLNIHRTEVVNKTKPDGTGYGYVQTELRPFNENQVWFGMSMNNYFHSGNITTIEIGEDSVRLESKQSGYGIAYPIKVTAGSKYALSFGNETEIGDSIIGIGFYDESGSCLSWVQEKKFTVPANAVWATVVMRPHANNEVTYKKPQLELGSTATGYEPYCGGIPSPNPDYPQPIESIKSVELVSRNADGSKSATRAIDLQGHELRSLPDGTHDELVVHRDGTVELMQRVGDTEMGSKDWLTYTAITTRKIYYTRFDGMVPANARGMCDAYTWQSWKPLDEIKHGIFQNHPTLSNAYFCNNETDTAADFRESVTGMHAYYPLATPQTIQLPSIDPLPTYYKYTFVDGNGADISARVRVMPA